MHGFEQLTFAPLDRKLIAVEMLTPDERAYVDAYHADTLAKVGPLVEGEVRAWLEKHPRFKLHFTPTSASWLNLVERFFAEITSKRIRRGSYSSVDALEGAIYDYLLQHNTKPKPFVWSKSAEDIITRERRALDALDEIRGNR
jgi:hypothetical protein